jgi:integrase
MTRTRTRNRDLPPRVYLHGLTYRYAAFDPVTRRNLAPINLGQDKAAALKKWAEIVGKTPDNHAVTVAALWSRYAQEELPKKSPASQASNRQQWSQLVKVFGEVAIHALTAQDAFIYLDLRGKRSPVQANREIALLRHMLTKARHWGLLSVNLLLNLQYRNAETARSRYVTDEELQAAIEAARPWLGALMWLAYLTGLRRGDLLRLTRFDCKEDGVHWVERKTHKRVVIAWSDELRNIIDKALEESPDTRLFPYTESAVNNAWGRFQRTWAASGQERFLLRDLRAKHASDFEAQGGNATTQLGHSTRAVTTRHYLRKPRQMVPIR